MSRDEDFTLFGIPIPDGLGHALEELFDLPWYVIFFWVSMGMALAFIILVFLLVVVYV